MPTGTETTVAVESHEAYGVVVTKRSTSRAGDDALQQEAALLDAARHPGVVGLVGCTGEDGAALVMTRWVGPICLRGAGSLPVTEIAGTMAALAETVADLHEIGVVHGALVPEHVLLSSEGRPVLCGFGHGAFMTDHRDGGPAPADDVAALGRLMRELVGEVELEPIPDRRVWRRRPRWSAFHRRALLNLADQATVGNGSTPLTARAMAAAIHDAVPDACLAAVGSTPPTERLSPTRAAAPPVRPPPAQSTADDGHQWHQPPSSASAPPTAKHVPTPAAGRLVLEAIDHALPGDVAGGSPPRPLVQRATSSPDQVFTNRSLRAGPLLASAGVAALVMSGVVWFAQRHTGDHRHTSGRTSLARGPAPTRATPGPTEPTSMVGPPPPTTISETPQGPSARLDCPTVTGPAADVDGDGCTEAVRIEGADVVTAGIHYGVGQRGDAVVVGDWDCDGRATPALLRPSTGEVFVFPRWAERASPLTVGASETVPGAATIASIDPDGDGCNQLVARAASGPAVVIDESSGP